MEQKVQTLASLIQSSGLAMFPYDEDAEAFFSAHARVAHGLLVTTEGSVEKAYQIFAEMMQLISKQQYFNLLKPLRQLLIWIRDFISGQEKTIEEILVQFQEFDTSKNRNKNYQIIILFIISAPLQQKISLIFQVVDQATKILQKEQKDKICVVWDREGFVKSQNHDEEFHSTMKPISELFANYCGEQVDMIYITHINWFFRAMFQIASKVSSKKVLSKIKLFDDPSNLQQVFPQSQLALMGYQYQKH